VNMHLIARCELLDRPADRGHASLTLAPTQFLPCVLSLAVRTRHLFFTSLTLG
jgi:hypothetical protein